MISKHKPLFYFTQANIKKIEMTDKLPLFYFLNSGCDMTGPTIL